MLCSTKASLCANACVCVAGATDAAAGSAACWGVVWFAASAWLTSACVCVADAAGAAAGSAACWGVVWFAASAWLTGACVCVAGATGAAGSAVCWGVIWFAASGWSLCGCSTTAGAGTGSGAVRASLEWEHETHNTQRQINPIFLTFALSTGQPVPMPLGWDLYG
ncbi:MAG: hypothetical protein LBK00_03565 [Treponema sp.]|nr:hypothetical protein [Treponema sp.]